MKKNKLLVMLACLGLLVTGCNKGGAMLQLKVQNHQPVLNNQAHKQHKANQHPHHLLKKNHQQKMISIIPYHLMQQRKTLAINGKRVMKVFGHSKSVKTTPRWTLLSPLR